VKGGGVPPSERPIRRSAVNTAFAGAGDRRSSKLFAI